VEALAFEMCESLTRLTFAIPSRLRKLDLPPSNFGSLSIPDSVEVLSGMLGRQEGQNRVVHFGQESRLMELDFNESEAARKRDDYSRLEQSLFVYLSEGALRRFRSKVQDF
jgi:hypothetical protein